ncbi:MAG: preprotein translocase subunit SecG [Devosiaceae bacterium]|nr:preprotein translocase subunit SecG [Devosiaceae bacterium]
MANVLIVAYLLIVLAMIATILLQRSEGGALGGLGGGSGGGLVSARGSANLLSRTTAILAALFMGTAIALSVVADIDRGTNSILDSLTVDGAQPSVLDALNSMQLESAGGNTLPVPNAMDTPTTNTPVPAAPASAAPGTTPDLPVPGSAPQAPGTGTSN